MNLLLLNYEYPPVGSGGGIISRYMAEGLAGRGHRLTVVTAWFHGLPEEETGGNIRIYRLKSVRKRAYQSNPFEMISWIRSAGKFLNGLCTEEKFDLCIANFAIPGGEVALRLKKKFKIPYVVISHGHDIPWVLPVSLYKYHLFTYFRLKQICRQSGLNFVQTAEMKNIIDRFTGKRFAGKNIVVPNGFDEDLFYPSSKRSFETLNILFSGRLTEQKDPVTLIKALKLLAEKNIPFRVQITGDGHLRQRLEKSVNASRLRDVVFFTGKLPYSEMGDLYRWSHLLAAPSVSEGMSLTVLEAIACGVYVIATPVSGNTSVINEQVTGKIIPIKDTLALAHAIHTYYKDKFMRRYTPPSDVLHGLEEKYAWNKIIGLYDKYLWEVIG